MDTLTKKTGSAMNNIYQTFRKSRRINHCERQFDNTFYAQCGVCMLDETLADILVIDEGFFERVFTPEGLKL